jgi:polysaccharide export outer membrane protein
VLQLFAQAKGFTRFAATKRIQLHRPQPGGTTRIYPLNYDAIISGRSPNGNVVVTEGDVFVVPARRLFE